MYDTPTPQMYMILGDCFAVRAGGKASMIPYAGEVVPAYREENGEAAWVGNAVFTGNAYKCP